MCSRHQGWHYVAMADPNNKDPLGLNENADLIVATEEGDGSTPPPDPRTDPKKLTGALLQTKAALKQFSFVP
jgi:hypothetical protein